MGDGREVPESLAMPAPNTEFSLKLFRHISSQTPLENVVLSPVSVSISLGMLALGASGNTRRQIGHCLEWPESVTEPVGEAKLMKELAFDLEIANLVLVRKEFPLRDEFTKTVSEQFLASVQPSNFSMTGELISLSNAWVLERTRGKIAHLVDQIDPQSCLLLLNATYFKKHWLHPFDPAVTRYQEFLNHGETPVAILTMVNTGSYGMTWDDALKCKVLELPYEGKECSMLILLPDDPKGVASLEARLNAGTLEHLLTQLRPIRAQVKLPRFKLEHGISMGPALTALGIVDAFTQGRANFSKMTSLPSLYVSEFLHRACVEVDEVGTEAAAATAVRINARSLPPTFEALHPFLFVLYHRRLQSVLFLGRISAFEEFPQGANP